MIYAHRGNINGPSDQENQIEHLMKAVEAGYGVEIDVWGLRTNGELVLWIGHDKPEYMTSIGIIQGLASWNNVILDCKNYEAMIYARQNFAGPRIDAYYYIPEHPVFSMSGRLVLPPNTVAPHDNMGIIQVMPEESTVESFRTYSLANVVTDYPGEYL